MSIVLVEDLRKNFGGFPVLKGVSLKVDRGVSGPAAQDLARRGRGTRRSARGELGVVGQPSPSTLIHGPAV